MKQILTLFALFLAANLAFSQESYTTAGIGYSMANVSQPKFADLLVKVNSENIGLTTPFSTEDLFQGLNFFGALRSEKSLFGFTYSRIANRYRAEGVLPVISPSTAGYKITSRQTQFSMQFDFFPIKFLGLGIEGGYTYSTFRDERKDLIFGETDQIVDKKGGLHGGANLILQVPLGRSVFMQLQPYWVRAFYKNDMDNVAAIYLGQSNSAAQKTELSTAGVHAKIGIKIQ